jgi:ribosomal-protein-alanine N-acetyltransferase
MTLQFPDSIPQLPCREFYLREIHLEDLSAYFELCSDREVMHAYGLEAHRDREETRRLITFLKRAFESGQMIRWGIFTWDHCLVGDVGFWRFVPSRLRAEVGAKLVKSQWRKGLTSGALYLVIKYGLEQMGLHSIEGNADPDNTPSRKMIEKLGFLPEGRLKEHSFNPVTGMFSDTILYSLHEIRSDFKAPEGILI